MQLTDHHRLVEAILFASAEPLSTETLRERLPEAGDVEALLRELQASYAGRGVELGEVSGRWQFRTAPDLSGALKLHTTVVRKLSRAAVETLAVIGYHQPVTRAEIEEIRGVAVSKGTIDALLEAGWIRPAGRKRVPGLPTTWGTTQAFLDHFGLARIDDLPGLEELRQLGLVDPSANVVPVAGAEEGDAAGDEPGEGGAATLPGDEDPDAEPRPELFDDSDVAPEAPGTQDAGTGDGKAAGSEPAPAPPRAEA